MSINQSDDRRSRRTRALLQNALIELMQKKTLNNIQIKEITERADVSRPAFYLHFDSKEELLFSHIDDLFAKLHKAVFEDRAAEQQITLRILVLTSFKVCKENAQAWQMAMQIDNKDMLMMRWRRHISAIMNEFAKQPSSNIAQHALHDYVVDFVTGGVYMLLQRWMKEGMKTSAEEMGQLAYQLVAHFTNVSLPPTKYPLQN